MTMHGDVPIADLRRQADLVALIGQHTRTSLTAVRFDSTYRGVCPLHSGASNPTSFHVFQTDDGAWLGKCYACGFVGDAFTFLASLWGCTYGEAVRRWKLDSGRQDYAAAPPKPMPRPQVLPPRQALVRRYHEQLHRQTSLGVTAYEWWKGQGIGPTTIERFQLGYAPECPTAPGTDSFTIPVGYRDQLLNIRHRLAHPPVKRTPLGEKDTGKYRGQRKGLGSQLFNADSLDVSGGDDVLIVGGEKKAMVLVDQGIETLMPVVCSTGGEASWQRGFDSALVGTWYDLLMDFRRVFVLFDNEPKMRQVAELTARVFGRRGYTVWVPGKVDDYLLANPETGLIGLMRALGNARPVLAGVPR